MNLSIQKIRKEAESQKGFTLVELAVVMIIIGLLIGGILKGQELITNAQVTSTVAQIKGLDAAVSTFRDTFKSLPGDMPTPAARLPAVCIDTCAFVGNGDGLTTADPSVVPVGESLAFFPQLAAVDLITGVNANPETAAVNTGDEIPFGSLSGTAIRVGQVVAAIPAGSSAGTGGAANTWNGGVYLGLGVTNVAAAMTTATGTAGMTAINALKIDQKIDDGNPVSGSVRGGGAATCAIAAGLTTAYNTTLTSNECNVFVRIQS